MARPRTPSNVLELRGAYKKNPNRAWPNEPKPNAPFGDCPDRLDQGEREAWGEIVSQCCPGVLTAADRLTVEMAARLLAELWEVGREFKDARFGRLQSLLGSIGMNPADRSKISVQPVKTANKFEKLGG